MPRRVSLPAADELFRNTGGAGVQPSTPQHSGGETRSKPSAGSVAPGGEEEPTEHASAAGEDRGDPSGQRTPARTPRQTRSSADVEGQSARQVAPKAASSGAAKSAARRPRAPRRPSGRERHDEKITVYVSAEELMDLEHARLVLRGEYGLAVDRGRIVREAVAVVLADLESRGEASILVRRLRSR